MSNSADVVVIGGGIAGTAAALAASSRGASVLMIRAAPGASALTVGGWWGVLPAPMAAAFEAIGHEWLPVREALPSPDGSLRRFNYAATSHAAADLTEPALVCGIAGLVGFHAGMLALLWGDLCDVSLIASEIVLPDTPAAGWSAPALASRIEQSSDPLARALVGAAGAARVSKIILPAVLGIEQVDAIRRGLERAVGTRVAEALGSTPALPGWRLQKALERMTVRANIGIVTGRVTNRSLTGARVERITVQSDGGTTQITGSAFVLATGKFVGGGITGNGRLREAALDCPIWIDHLGERFERVEPLTLTNADRREDQPVLEAGVSSDAEGRPVGPHGAIVFDNVWVAGAARAGADPGLGRAASEGWAAGERAST